MSNERKPQPKAENPHMEKQTMTEPQEEFVQDQSVPSKSMQSSGSESSSSPQRVHDVKEAGDQKNKPKGQNFEPGVEG